MPESPPHGRSGCAVVSGFFLITLGVLLLGFNLGGLAFLRRGAVVFDWLSVYWPLFLVLWGAHKLVQRIRTPERSRVTAFEVVGLVFFVFIGLALSAGRRAVDRLSREGELDHVVELVGPELLGPRREFVENESFPLEPGEPEAKVGLLVENGRGGVSVRGSNEDRIQVTIIKRFHELSDAKARDIADAVTLELVTPGSDEDEEGRNALRVTGTDGRRVETELILEVPRRTALEVRTRRGRVEVEDISGDIDLRTSEASVEASRIEGSVAARTDRGEVRLTAIAGSARVDSSRGAVYARDISGSLEARTSRSAIVAEDISGSVTLENRHGSLRARGVGGEVTIDAYNTDVAVESLGSGARIEANQGTVFVKDVSRDVTLNARRASVQLSGIRGGLVVEGTDARTTMTDVEGTLRFTARQSDVNAAELRGPAVIEDAGDVEISGFASDLKVTSRHGNIRIETAALEGNVTLESSYGDVELTLPREASTRLEARTEDGTLQSNLESFERSGEAVVEGDSSGGDERRWVGLLGAGSRETTLISRHGDLRFTVREP